MKIALIVLACCFSLPAWGQGETPEEKVSIASQNLLPTTWPIHVADELSWKAFALRYKVPLADRAFTIFKGDSATYVRRSYVEHATPQQLRHTFAHEAGHVACSCRIEEVAELWANRHL